MKNKPITQILRTLGGVLCLLAAAVFLLPINLGILHIGMLYPALGFALLALFLFFFRPVCRFFTVHRVLLTAVCVLLILAVLIMAIPFCMMVSASMNQPQENGAPLIVLGCQVRGTEPSLMLAARCKAALGYLNAHPDAVCIASGGQGGGEMISEAEAIKTYLVSHGIEPERILCEPDSENTFENIRNSAALLAENGLPTDVVIASDGFHQYRAQLFCRQFGLNASACSCRTLWVLAPGYWAREILAVWKAIILRR